MRYTKNSGIMNKIIIGGKIMIKIAFFDTKEYDKELFDKYSKNYGYEIT